MDYFTSAKQLVSFAKASLAIISKSYDVSLSEKIVKPELLIEIKNFMENLRSALDYTAHGLHDKYGTERPNVNVYFPYAWSGLSKADFRAKKVINSRIPGLSTVRPDIETKIEGYQHFADPRNDWLPKFMDLNNENKHQNLTHQERTETRQLNITSGGAGISMGQGAGIVLGKGAFIKIGNAVIPGGQKIDVNNPAVIIGNAKQEIVIWVSFRFASNNEPVLPLLQASLKGVDEIVNELSQL